MSHKWFTFRTNNNVLKWYHMQYSSICNLWKFDMCYLLNHVVVVALFCCQFGLYLSEQKVIKFSEEKEFQKPKEYMCQVTLDGRSILENKLKTKYIIKQTIHSRNMINIEWVQGQDPEEIVYETNNKKKRS